MIFGVYNACLGKNGTLGMFLPKCAIMAAAEVINSRLMCVRCYLSSSSRGARAETRVTGQHNERDMACQLGQLLLWWDRVLCMSVCMFVCMHGFVSSHFPVLSSLPLSMYFSSAASRNTATRTHSLPHAHSDKLIGVAVGMPVALCQSLR